MKFEKLGNIASVIAGQSPPSSTYNSDGHGIPFFQGKADYGEKYPTVRFWCTEPTKISLPEDILISMRAPVGPVNINKVKSCIGRGLSAIRVKENVSRDYIYYWLKQNQHIISAKETGSTFKAITQKILSEIVIPFPNYSDQLHIANILGRAENLISQRKRSIHLLDEFLKSTFSDLFDNPVKNRKRFKIVRLKELITFLTSGGRGWGEYYSEKGERFIRSLDVQMNYISNEDSAFVNPPNNQEANRTKVQDFDILLTITGSKIGRVAMVPVNFGRAYVSQHVAIIRTQNINPLYLSYYLSDVNCGQYLIQKCYYGQTKPGLNFKQIENFEIIIPPIELQNQFAQIVEKTDALKAQYQQSLLELEILYGSLSQRAFKGELTLK